MNHSHEHGNGRPSGPNWSRINQWVLWIGLAAAVAWMFFRQNAHLGQLLPFLSLPADAPVRARRAWWPRWAWRRVGHEAQGRRTPASPRWPGRPPALKPKESPHANH